MQRLRLAALAAAALLMAMGAARAIELEVRNESKTKIVHLFMSEVDQKNWGEDQLGADDQDTIDPEDSYTLEDIEPGVYDLKLVAEDGTACVLSNVRFAQGKVWTITEDLLNACVKQQ
jgi:hypothetical protein